MGKAMRKHLRKRALRVRMVATLQTADGRSATSTAKTRIPRRR
jgi:hypothetical protein